MCYIGSNCWNYLKQKHFDGFVTLTCGFERRPPKQVKIYFKAVWWLKATVRVNFGTAGGHQDMIYVWFMYDVCINGCVWGDTPATPAHTQIILNHTSII